MSKELEELISLVERWQGQRIPLAKEFTRNGLSEFVGTMNAITRQLMSVTGKSDPGFWSAWIELGQQASTFSQNGKVFVADQDRTND